MKKKEQIHARDPKEELEENWESEAHPNRQEWDLRYGFYKPTTDRYGLVCWTCKYSGHRSWNCAVKWGGDPRSQGPNCTIDGKYRHKAQWCTTAGDHKLGIKQINMLLPPTRKAKNPGNAARLPVKE